jgi:hypothetical protein
MKRKQDYGVLLNAFRPGTEAKPVRRSKRSGSTWTIPTDIALPSLAELLAIDEAAERAAARLQMAIAATRKPVGERGPVNATSGDGRR